MLTKLYSFLLIVCAISFSQNQVNISGTVSDKDSNMPIKGASVKLIARNLTSTTDSSGYFHIAGTSIKNPQIARRSSLSLVPGKCGFIFENEMDGHAEIRMYDLCGRLNAAVFSGMLTSGVWRISQPVLPPGVYICAVTTPKSTSSIRFMSVLQDNSGDAKGIGKAGNITKKMELGGMAKNNAKPSGIDSLSVTKDGYSPIKMAMDTLVKDGLKITLTADTATTGDVTIVPDTSWACFMPDGIPPPEKGQKAFTITLQYSAMHDVGVTKFGHRRQFDVSGGTIKGDKIDGTFLTGGLDYELTLSTGSIELEQIDIFKVGNVSVLMRNAGVAPAGFKAVRVVLDFEAQNSSSVDWLNTGKFAATRIVDSTAKTIKLDVYDISKVTAPATRIQIKDPEGVPNQTWDCLKWSGNQGSTVFTENVTLGSTVSFSSKRGSRNIIPITGGKTTGKVTGKILAGGADYQLNGLDARYTLSPDDGEFIIVRNCGSGALIPVFETRVGGKYDFLNENKYLSSQPGGGTGGVSITFYERK